MLVAFEWNGEPLGQINRTRQIVDVALQAPVLHESEIRFGDGPAQSFAALLFESPNNQKEIPGRIGSRGE